MPFLRANSITGPVLVAPCGRRIFTSQSSQAPMRMCSRMTTSVDRSFSDETWITNPFTCCSVDITSDVSASVTSNQAPAWKTALELDAVIQAVARSLQSYNGIDCTQRLKLLVIRLEFKL